MSADEETPPSLDPSRYVRPALPPAVRVIEGVTFRIVERLPERTLRDSLPFTFAADVLPSS